MKKFVYYGALFFTLVTAQTAMAFGEYGHVTICEIAYRELSPNARTELNRLMKIHPYNTSYNRACMFADDGPAKSMDPKESRVKQRKLAHFVNVPRSFDHIGTSECSVSDDCSFKAIEDEINTLSSDTTTDAEKARAMVLLGHWIGDLHQPLHVSFKDDAGGNGVATSGKLCGMYKNYNTGKKEPPALHSIWDSCIINRGIFEYSWVQNWFGWKRHTKSYRAADSLRAEIDDINRQTWINSNMQDWADESYKIAISPSVGYCRVESGQCKKPQGKVIVDDNYISRHTPIVKQRMKMAGVRLANELNKVLDPEFTDE